MHVNVSEASTSQCECVCRSLRVHVSADVCVYELVIALTHDKTMREMFQLSEVLHF